MGKRPGQWCDGDTRTVTDFADKNKIVDQQRLFHRSAGDNKSFKDKGTDKGSGNHSKRAASIHSLTFDFFRVPSSGCFTSLKEKFILHVVLDK